MADFERCYPHIGNHGHQCEFFFLSVWIIAGLPYCSILSVEFPALDWHPAPASLLSWPARISRYSWMKKRASWTERTQPAMTSSSWNSLSIFWTIKMWLFGFVVYLISFFYVSGMSRWPSTTTAVLRPTRPLNYGVVFVRQNLAYFENPFAV